MAKILSLADGTVTLLPRGLPAGASTSVTLAQDHIDRIFDLAAGELSKQGINPLSTITATMKAKNPGPVPFMPPSATDAQAAYITTHPQAPAPATGGASFSIGGHNFQVTQLSDAYVEALGDSAERLASMVMARKLRSADPISPLEASMMTGLAGFPDTHAGRFLTDRILQASVDELGKGNPISAAVKSISGTISSVAKKVIVPVTRAVAAAAPILSKVPVIGPALGAAAQIQYNAVNAMANGNIRSLTAGGVTGTISRLAAGGGAAVGAVVGLAGAGAEGIIEAPGVIASDLASAGQWAYDKAGGMMSSVSSYLGGNIGSGGFFNTLVQSGRSLVSSFDASVASTIESVNPALSGELTSMFHGLGSEYSSFAHVFDAWSMKMKASPTGTALVGSLNGNLYSMVKDAMGHISLTQTPKQNAPVAAGTLADGALITADQLSGLGVPVSGAGTGYGPGYSGSAAGMPVSPAGISYPGGSIAPGTDNTSLAIIAQSIAQANAGRSPEPAPQLAGMPIWAVAGLGLAGLALILKGGIDLGPSSRPRYVSRGRRR